MQTVATVGAPSRTLTQAELEAYVRCWADDPELWGEHVEHDPGRRRFTELLRTSDVEVWLVCWMPGHDTGWHDHGSSAGAVAVASGAVQEQRLQRDGSLGESRHVAGERFSFSSEVVHRVRHADLAPAVTLHAYSPPLRGTSAYRLGERGDWARVTVGQDQELRPI